MDTYLSRNDGANPVATLASAWQEIRDLQELVGAMRESIQQLRDDNERLLGLIESIVALDKIRAQSFSALSDRVDLVVQRRVEQGAI